VLVLFVLAAFLVYGHNTLRDVTRTFVDLRKSDAQYFSELLRSNWDGITSIPAERKQNLLKSLDPEIAGSDLETMGFFARFFLYLLVAALMLGRAIVIARELLGRTRASSSETS
jgi:hypothetical protein